jgi:hypothetical protein
MLQLGNQRLLVVLPCFVTGGAGQVAWAADGEK